VFKWGGMERQQILEKRNPKMYQNDRKTRSNYCEQKEETSRATNRRIAKGERQTVHHLGPLTQVQNFEINLKRGAKRTLKNPSAGKEGENADTLPPPT